MKKAVGIATVSLLLAFIIGFAVFDGVFNKNISGNFFAMDTVVSFDITGKDSEEAAEQAEKTVKTLDSEILSRHNESSFTARVNKTAGGRMEDHFKSYVSTLLDVNAKSNGAFDFTLGAVSDLWSFNDSPRVPDSSEIIDALSHSGCGKIKIEEDYLSLTDAQTVLDFGAAGKGIALDEIKNNFADKTVKRAIVSVGGSVLLYGEDKFTVGIRKPDGNAGEFIGILTVDACCISTSGSYERNFEENGLTYHHILDPKTGYPVDNGIISVTVISDSGILSDTLSTACFVLGTEEGMKLAEEYGCETVFVTSDKKIYASDGAAKMLEITDSEYTAVN